MPDSSSPATDVDNEEARLFNDMSPNFKRSKRGAPAPRHRNYHVFAQRWNEMVATKFRHWCSGDEDIILPRLKSTLQLQEYYDKREQLTSLNSVVPGHDDEDRDELRNIMRANRDRLPTPTAPYRVSPCLLYTSPSPRDQRGSRMPSSA